MANMPQLGQSFESWEAAKNCLDNFGTSNFFVWALDTSKTVVAENKKLLAKGEEPYNESLRYKNVKLCCVFGGKMRIGSGTGARPNQSTFKRGCPVFVHLIAKNKESITIVDLVLSPHSGHECSEEIYAVLPKVRRENLKEKVASSTAKLLFQGGVKPCRVRTVLRGLGCGHTTQRDLQNFRQNLKKESLGGLTPEEKLVAVLEELFEEDPEAHIQIGKSEENELTFLFIQTSVMRKNMIKYGRVLLLDHTYKLNKNRMPLSCFLTMDGDGDGRSVGYSFVANEQLATIKQVTMAFKEAIGPETASHINCITVDKDYTEIRALSEVFPDALLQLCDFHVSRTFDSKTHQENSRVREILTELRYCTLEESFDNLVVELREEASQSFLEYFDKNWLLCPVAWSYRDRKKVANMGNATNNRLECHNSKLKMIINSCNELYEAVQGILQLVKNKEEDVIYRNVTVAIKQSYLTKCKYPVANEVVNDLTSFAAKLLIYELDQDPPDNEMVKFKATVNQCSCIHACAYFNLMPCRRMLACRRQTGVPVYVKSEIDTMFWKSCLSSVVENTSLSRPHIECVVVPSKIIPKTHDQRYNHALSVAKMICSVLAECGGNQFSDRYMVLKDLLKLWSAGKEVKIVDAAEFAEFHVVTVPHCDKQLNEGATTNVLNDSQPDNDGQSNGTIATGFQLVTVPLDQNPLNEGSAGSPEVSGTVTTTLHSDNQSTEDRRTHITATSAVHGAHQINAKSPSACTATLAEAIGLQKPQLVKASTRAPSAPSKAGTLGNNSVLEVPSVDLSALLDDEGEKDLLDLVKSLDHFDNSEPVVEDNKLKCTQDDKEKRDFLSDDEGQQNIIDLIEILDQAESSKPVAGDQRQESFGSENTLFGSESGTPSPSNLLKQTLDGIELPQKVKHKGRPQGLGKTVVKSFPKKGPNWKGNNATNKKAKKAKGAVMASTDSELLLREERGLAIPDEHVTVEEEHVRWTVKSQSSDAVYYRVQFMPHLSCQCSSGPEICIHVLQCSCHDFIYRKLACKHVHKIAAFAKEMKESDLYFDISHEVGLPNKTNDLPPSDQSPSRKNLLLVPPFSTKKIIGAETSYAWDGPAVFPDVGPSDSFYIQKFTFYNSDFECLKCEEFLNDNDIDAFISVVSKEDVAQPDASVLCLSAVALEHITMGVNSYIERARNASYLFNDLWLVPSHVYRNHWIFFVVIVKMKIILVLDSLYKKLTSCTKEHLQVLRLLIEESHKQCFETLPKWEDWSVYFPNDITTQDNSYGCGLYVCIWAYCILTKSLVPSQMCTMSKKLRTWVANVLFSKAIPRPPQPKCDNSRDVEFIDEVYDVLDKQKVTEGLCHKPWHNIPDPIILYSSPDSRPTSVFLSQLVEGLWKATGERCGAPEGCRVVGYHDMVQCECCREWLHPLCIGEKRQLPQGDDPYLCPSHNLGKTRTRRVLKPVRFRRSLN